MLTPCYCHFFDRKVMQCTFSAGQRTSTYNYCDATCSLWCTIIALASKIPRSLTNWTRMGHDEAGTYSFSRVCHNHCRIATTGARCLGQSIAGWHSAPLSPFACENLHSCYAARRLHCVLMRLFAYPLLWLVYFIWSEFVIMYSHNDKLPVTSIFTKWTVL